MVWPCGSTQCDAHLKTALEILRGIEEENKHISDPACQFRVRVGINESDDDTGVTRYQ
jgi:hypothetical protein